MRLKTHVYNECMICSSSPICCKLLAIALRILTKSNLLYKTWNYPHYTSCCELVCLIFQYNSSLHFRIVWYSIGEKNLNLWKTNYCHSSFVYFFLPISCIVMKREKRVENKLIRATHSQTIMLYLGLLSVVLSVFLA